MRSVLSERGTGARGVSNTCAEALRSSFELGRAVGMVAGSQLAHSGRLRMKRV